MSKHPIGFNVRSGIDWGKLLTQVKAMGGCRAMVFRCYASELHRLHDYKTLVDTLVWLPNEFVPEKLHLQEPDAVKWVNDRRSEMIAAGFEPGDLYLHLHNESGWSAEMIAWEAAATAHAISKSMKVVALNQGVGNPNEHQTHMADAVLKLAAGNPSVLIGVHDGYFSVFGERTYPWFLGRWCAASHEVNGGHSYESYRQSKSWGAIRYLISEGGAEDISKDHPFTSALPRTGSRKHVGPFKANEEAWKRRSGGQFKSLDMEYISEIKASWLVGKMDDARLAGYCLYTWGDNGGQWADYDVSNQSLFLSELVKWKPTVNEPPPVDPPAEPPNLTPKADDPRWQRNWKVSSTGKDGTKLRDRPERGSQVASITFAGTAAHHIPYMLMSVAEKEFAKPVGHVWAVFKLPSGIIGWSRSDVVIAEPPAEPEPEPVYITMAQAQTLVDERLGEFRNQIMAIVAEYMDAREVASDTAVIRKIGAALTIFGTTNKQIQLEDKAS